MTPYRVPDPIPIFRFFENDIVIPVYDINDKEFDLTTFLTEVSLCEFVIKRRGFSPLETGDDIFPDDDSYPTYSIGEGVMVLLVDLADNVSKNSLTFSMNKFQTAWLNPKYFYLFELYVDESDSLTERRELIANGEIALKNFGEFESFGDSVNNATVDGVE